MIEEPEPDGPTEDEAVETLDAYTEKPEYAAVDLPTDVRDGTIEENEGGEGGRV
jgi:hypothetical protein